MDVSANRCACGAPVAVVGDGRFRHAFDRCDSCLLRDADREEAEQPRETADPVPARRIAARLVAPRFADWRLPTAETSEAERLALAWRDAFLEATVGCDLAARSRNLVLIGGVGSGKTGLAWCLLRDLVDAGHTGLYLEVRELLGELRASIGAGASERRGAATVDVASRCDVLVLDDVAAERPTRWGVDQIGLIVERRHRDLLPTIATSTYTPNALLRRLSPEGDATAAQRIVSRLLHGAVTAILPGDDRRIREAAGSRRRTTVTSRLS